MALLEDLKQDLTNRINRVDNIDDLLTLFSRLHAPLDVDILDNYFGWYRVKTIDELEDEYKNNTEFYRISDTNSQYYALEVQQVRLLQVEPNRFINKNFGLDLLDWMIEPIT